MALATKPQDAISAWLEQMPTLRRQYRTAPGTLCENPACRCDCGGRRVTRGLCNTCYAYWLAHGVQRPFSVIQHGAEYHQTASQRRQVRVNYFGRRLYRARVAADLSINELARAAGCDPSYISRLEQGERNPPRRPLVEILALLLNLDDAATDRLLLAAGYAPASLLENAG